MSVEVVHLFYPSSHVSIEESIYFTPPLMSVEGVHLFYPSSHVSRGGPSILPRPLMLVERGPSLTQMLTY